MTEVRIPSVNGHAPAPLDKAAEILLSVPQSKWRALITNALTFIPESTLEESFEVGPLRAVLVEFWEEVTRKPVPIARLRRHFGGGSDCKTLLVLDALSEANSASGVVAAVSSLIGHLAQLESDQSHPSLFDWESPSAPAVASDECYGGVVNDLRELIAAGRKFTTIYADPPWAYNNEASRGAAINHYPTMSVDAICEEPVADLASDNAHLHLWTTNAFLRDAFRVIDAWGFSFKSCFVWVKDEIGMGNYWRVSHEFLLLGVRGQLRFLDRAEPSWKRCRRTIHSRKPEAIRMIVERVSPGPYLELYGRREIPTSPWTVYGNQVERRLF